MLPFLNWAGGKRWLTSTHLDKFPRKYNRYIEPFLGSGAVFFSLKPKNAVLSDINTELVESFQEVKHHPTQIEALLAIHHRRHSKEYYYQQRAINYASTQERAARFIYLNRTCWNGLYRVNLKGKFNVPIGTKKNVVLRTDDFQKASSLLQTVKLNVCDFENAIGIASRGDLVFVDPPYTVKHNNNAFVQYNEALFSWDDQIRLSKCLVAAKARGAVIVATNACHKSIAELYSHDFRTTIAKRPSTLSGDSTRRKKIEEFIFTSF